MQRLIISLKFVNSKCDNFQFFIVRGQSITNYYQEDESIWKILAIEINCQILALKLRVLLYNSF